jgi:hypothetical protein
MATLLNRGLSLFVALIYLTAAYLCGSGLDMAKVAVALLLPMACIWFPDALGEYTGIMRLQAITASTPAFLVCAGGWLLLVGVPLAAYFIMKASEQT